MNNYRSLNHTKWECHTWYSSRSRQGHERGSEQRESRVESPGVSIPPKYSVGDWVYQGEKCDPHRSGVTSFLGARLLRLDG